MAVSGKQRKSSRRASYWYDHRKPRDCDTAHLRRCSIFMLCEPDSSSTQKRSSEALGHDRNEITLLTSSRACFRSILIQLGPNSLTTSLIRTQSNFSCFFRTIKNLITSRYTTSSPCPSTKDTAYRSGHRTSTAMSSSTSSSGKLSHPCSYSPSLTSHKYPGIHSSASQTQCNSANPSTA